MLKRGFDISHVIHQVTTFCQSIKSVIFYYLLSSGNQIWRNIMDLGFRWNVPEKVKICFKKSLQMLCWKLAKTVRTANVFMIMPLRSRISIISSPIIFPLYSSNKDKNMTIENMTIYSEPWNYIYDYRESESGLTLFDTFSVNRKYAWWIINSQKSLFCE